MRRLSEARHRFASVIIQHAVWLCFRFAPSRRDVEDLLAERGIDVPYATVRRWRLEFGVACARRNLTRRSWPSRRWHLDEVFIRSQG